MSSGWDADVEELEDAAAVRIVPTDRGTPLPYGDVLVRWSEDASFRRAFARLLADAPFRAYRFETPSVSRAALHRPFELVLLRSDGLDRPADPAPFREHLAAAAGEEVTVFDNLGGDATMIVPRPAGDPSAYAHLAAFVRRAPARQVDELWRTVGETLRRTLDDGAPRWLNTEGSGVAWLHVRIDSRPKYYGHAPYARGDPTGPPPARRRR